MGPGNKDLLTPSRSGFPTAFNVFAHRGLGCCLFGKSVACSPAEEVLVKPPRPP